MQRFKGGRGGRGWRRIDITNEYLVNPSHDFTCTLVNERMKMLMEKFGLKAEKEGEYQDIRELHYKFL